jgi:hypothetical protein
MVQVFLDKCKKCGDVLSAEFLTVGEDKFHVGCFTCQQCRQVWQTYSTIVHRVLHVPTVQTGMADIQYYSPQGASRANSADRYGRQSPHRLLHLLTVQTGIKFHIGCLLVNCRQTWQAYSTYIVSPVSCEDTCNKILYIDFFACSRYSEHIAPTREKRLRVSKGSGSYRLW